MKREANNPSMPGALKGGKNRHEPDFKRKRGHEGEEKEGNPGPQGAEKT